MKKIIQFSVMLLLFSNTLFAQNLSVGVKHGVNNTGINFKHDDLFNSSNPSYYGFDNIRNNSNFGLIINQVEC